MATIMTWVGSGSVMAASLPSRVGRRTSQLVSTPSYRRPEPALSAAIWSCRSSTHRMQHPDPSSRHPAGPPAGTPAVAAGRLAPSCLPARPGRMFCYWWLACHPGAGRSGTVTAALRILGRQQETDFPIYHGVLKPRLYGRPAPSQGWLLWASAGRHFPQSRRRRGDWDRRYHRRRRWGQKISARGIYRDPVRSSKGHFVKTSGLRWLSAQLLVHIPWVGRIMGLPFLTVLAPSKRFYADKPRSPKTLLDWARQVALQIHRWLPGRRIVHRRRHCVRRGRFPRCRPEIMSASTHDCATTPISMPPHHPDDRAADDRRSRASACPH